MVYHHLEACGFSKATSAPCLSALPQNTADSSGDRAFSHHQVAGQASFTSTPQYPEAILDYQYRQQRPAQECKALKKSALELLVTGLTGVGYQ